MDRDKAESGNTLDGRLSKNVSQARVRPMEQMMCRERFFKTHAGGPLEQHRLLFFRELTDTRDVWPRAQIHHSSVYTLHKKYCSTTEVDIPNEIRNLDMIISQGGREGEKNGHYPQFPLA